ncbi:AAA family ATPase [Alteribacillus bidgolensis]|uniref:AAA+-type ATPase, SpoVK/Ycf46/Vps4 family n=1 Tax=Alteribacillus bidgolensis TaxID=930129 RepID=A0A1G8D4P4_9BACI|nr:AAA family ATPase [Alteribacillus bidgolensis]SDH52533.1 AAA+-type ATPase, SpoVK/Ycf46/Vps4 family [Alteribacillus bidgolensis]
MSISNYDVVTLDIETWENQMNYFSPKEAQYILEQADIENEQEKQTAAKIYGLLARDRYNKRYRFDPMVKNWIANGLELNDEEPILLKLSALEQIEYMKDTIFSLPLTSIRETDQSSARKKAAAQLKDMADKELHALHESKELLKSKYNTLEQLASKQSFDLHTLDELIDKGMGLFTTLHNAADEYLRTAAGSFYSPEQVKIIKTAVSDLTELKQQWHELLQQTAAIPHTEQNPLDELHQMIGLTTVKNRVHRLYHYLQYQKQRKEKGYHLNDERSLHMILTGNPGTGKTMLARLLAKIYHQLGLLQRDEVLEADRSQLVGGYVGQTEEKTINLVKEAVGGILFIDEAYSLKREGMSGNDFGQTAIDTLVSAMTSGEYAGTFAVILAGYPEEMRQFLRSNPGLRSRFPESNHIHLPDYSADELLEIAEKVALDNDFVISEDGKKELEKRIEKEQVDETFGNARTAKNIVMDAIFQKGAKIGGESSSHMDDFALLTAEDMKDPALTENTKDSESPLSRLDSLIGLKEVKQEMKKLASFIHIQNERRKADIPVAPIQLHTVFTGPPGTGKTTVANLYASILKDMGLLKRGHTVVCGRSDLVAEYTGQTAAKTRRKIREALGGVLFIDEAYSLAAPGRGDFGREALDTLVEEMTKHDENLVVILSGYPGPMDQLFQTNPGLQSRFKKSFYFPSFVPDELAAVTDQYVRGYGYYFENGALDYLKYVYVTMDTSGNARFAEDMAEELFQQQAFRLTENNETALDALRLLTKEDINAAFIYKQAESGDSKNENNGNKN